MAEEFYAYGDGIDEKAQYTGLEAVMRIHAVKRWHMIDTTRTQTLAEHSANVALLAFYISTTSPLMFFGPSSYVMMHGLLHDMAEVFTGDIPSHTKKHLSGIHELEKRVLPTVFTSTPSPHIAALVKLCDLGDGIRFIRLHGVDITSQHARKGLEEKMANLIEKVTLEWPPLVVSHAVSCVRFYAYEYS